VYLHQPVEAALRGVSPGRAASRASTYKVLDTDAREFGGNGHNWINEYETAPQPAFHHPHSFCTQLLPLHGMIFRAISAQPEG
jgi:hypothetical protein